MVKNEKENRSKTPARQAFQEMRREANKIEASTPYQFNGKNLTAYGGLLPVGSNRIPRLSTKAQQTIPTEADRNPQNSTRFNNLAGPD